LTEKASKGRTKDWTKERVEAPTKGRVSPRGHARGNPATRFRVSSFETFPALSRASFPFRLPFSPVFFFAAVLFLFFLFFPFPPGLRAETLKIIYPEAPRTLDPHAFPPDPNAIPIIMNVYDRLFDLEDDSNVLETSESLARTARVSDDGTRYTIILKEGETFADGTPVNPEAVLFSLDRLMASETGKVFFPYLKNMTIEGPNTFVLGLSKPFPAFLASLALPQASIISPALAGHPPDYLKTRSLGSGSHEVETFEKDRIFLSRRAELLGALTPDGVEILYVPEPEKRIPALVENGARIALLSFPVSGGAPPNHEILMFPSWTSRFLAFNQDSRWLRDKDARAALAALAKNAFRHKNVRPPSILPKGFAGAPPSVPQSTLAGSTAEERAKDLLSRSGTPVTPLRLAHRTDETNSLEDARALAAVFLEHKVPTNLVPLTGSAGKGIMERGDYDMYLGTRHPEIPSSEMWLGRFLDSRAGVESNPARFNDPSADSRIDNFDASLSRPERETRLKSLATLASNLNPYVILYQFEVPFLLDDRIENFRPHPMWPAAFPFDEITVNPFGAAPPAKEEVPLPPDDFDETVFEFYE
jgi:peptide/nickel transport system substrate-binding protein